MSPTAFESYSQNGEDVVLWRALQDASPGRYVEVGASHPFADSVSAAFYQRGWSGITVEPNPHFAQMQRDQRPRDIHVEAAVTAEDGGNVTLHVVDGTGLSTLNDGLATAHEGSGYATHDVEVPTRRLDTILEEAGWAGQDIHFMSIDTEGSEQAVLESVDLTAWRPWVLVVEATEPNSTRSTRERWEHLVVAAGYHFCLFDGLSCFYVAEEHRERIGPALSYPACILDDYTTLAYRQAAAADADQLNQELDRWREQAISRWATAVSNRAALSEVRAEVDALRGENANLAHQHAALLAETASLRNWLTEMHQSASWRVTRPLRGAKGALMAIRRR